METEIGRSETAPQTPLLTIDYGASTVLRGIPDQARSNYSKPGTPVESQPILEPLTAEEETGELLWESTVLPNNLKNNKQSETTLLQNLTLFPPSSSVLSSAGDRAIAKEAPAQSEDAVNREAISQLEKELRPPKVESTKPGSKAEERVPEGVEGKTEYWAKRLNFQYNRLTAEDLTKFINSSRNEVDKQQATDLLLNFYAIRKLSSDWLAPSDWSGVPSDRTISKADLKTYFAIEDYLEKLPKKLDDEAKEWGRFDKSKHLTKWQREHCVLMMRDMLYGDFENFNSHLRALNNREKDARAVFRNIIREMGDGDTSPGRKNCPDEYNGCDGALSFQFNGKGIDIFNKKAFMEKCLFFDVAKEPQICRRTYDRYEYLYIPMLFDSVERSFADIGSLVRKKVLNTNNVRPN